VQQTDYSAVALLGVYTITMVCFRESKSAIFGEGGRDAGRELRVTLVLKEGHIKLFNSYWNLLLKYAKIERTKLHEEK